MNYYVLCPYGLVTGGPDALHQLVYYLNKVNKNAKLVYLNATSYEHKIPEQYSRYIDGYILYKDLVDSKDNVIIIPEFLSHLAKKYKEAKVYIWWLSVDYNLDKTSFLYKCLLISTYPIRALKYRNIGLKRFNMMFKNVLFKSKYNFKKEQINVSHLCASYYAYDYVTKNGCRKASLCIEPISIKFLEDSVVTSAKEDIVIYNPKKCGEYVNKIIEKSNNQFHFLPLIGYSQKELIDIYKMAKVYIDFGPFPGAERMPKEAVLNGCAIITGKFGASNYHGDVPIKDEYKIEANDKNISLIIEKIKYCLTNYDNIVKDFDEYRDTVLSLENNFIKKLEEV